MQKQTFNLHTHTWRCGHASGTDKEYIEAAISAGFRVLGFSDHLQYRADNGKYGRIDFEDFQDYFAEINAFRSEYSKDIDIICGIEAAYIPNAMSELIEIYPLCDYILLGQHQGGISERKYCLKCDDKDVLQYAIDIENGLKTGLYSILAHPDFFMNVRSTWSDACTKASERICIAAKENQIPLEVNIKGAYSKKRSIGGIERVSYPSREFWSIVASVGNNVIYGWDAHSPADLLRSTSAADDILRGLDLNWLIDSPQFAKGKLCWISARHNNTATFR